MSGYDYHHAPQDILAERKAIAERVCRELESAGLPAFRLGEGEGEWEGAAVTVDSGADAAGGVTVSWKCALGRAAAERLSAGDVQARVIQQSGVVSQHMQQAIIGLLRAAGMDADTDEDDMNPLAVRVVSR